jgi:hypothetical protein
MLTLVLSAPIVVKPFKFNSYLSNIRRALRYISIAVSLESSIKSIRTRKKIWIGVSIEIKISYCYLF